ncbi:hypothetical protein B7494_g8306 [Chlorociboria aeruginascens]|nr:hypothetical protein B7494_g8306 [Chlorociboria aeruginascens]
MSSLPFKVKAVYEYASPHDDDLHFPNGQIITVTEEEDDDWYAGEYVDALGIKQEGIFPRNFVEKYEPTAPPRPTRTHRPKKEAEAQSPPAPAPTTTEPSQENAPEHEEPEETPVARDPPPSIPKAQASSPVIPKPLEISSPPAPTVAKPAPSSSKAPPPVSDKPSGGSFRDRIAAFNKAAPPVAPFKPGGLSSSGASTFIRKPFVAPPPSKNAYVAPPREPVPQKIYKREEDPEIVAKEAENQEHAEKAGLAANGGEDEDQPKPTSLKERIALLQKQQMEQASRHADAAQKKEKPKRPAKKRSESHGPDGADEGEGAALERHDTEETVGKPSMDSVREESSVPRRRKSSKGAVATPGIHFRKSFGDGNDADMSGAGDTTEEPEEMSTGRDDSDETPRNRGPPPRAPTIPLREPDVGEEEGVTEEGEALQEEDEEEEEEEEDIDPEVRRKEELRARMAKMSGGMGMHGMFGAMPMPTPVPPKKKKATSTNEKQSGEYGREEAPTARAPHVPMIPLPGMSRVRSPDDINEAENEDDDSISFASRPADEVPDIEDVVPSNERGAPPVPSHEVSGAPPIPGGRPAPPPVPKDTRPTVMSPSAGSESDDELSSNAQGLSLATPKGEVPQAPSRPSEPIGSPRLPQTKRASYFGTDQSPTSPTAPGSNNKRASRVPPIPGATNAAPPQARAVPPLPPSRSSTGDVKIMPSSPRHVAPEPSDEEVTEYEGDYDTDIASTAPHKDALKTQSHARDSSFDEKIPVRSPVSSPILPPSAPRGGPPPLPSQPPPPTRQSTDMPRGAPPPPPVSKAPAPWEPVEDDEYDPFRYTAPKQSLPSISSPTSRLELHEEDLYSTSPPRSHTLPIERAAPPPPPRDTLTGPPTSSRAPTRQSLDISRSGTTGRRSVELTRMSMDSGYVANDVDLAQSTQWWKEPNGIPPSFKNRKDILFESEVSTSSKRGGRTTTTKDLYILFQDYSQTVITVQYDAQDPSDVKLEQRHEQPPARVRQDQLEEAHEQLGRVISDGVSSRKDTVVGDGTPHGLVQELLEPLTSALRPVGTRAFGAVVYANLANASTQQNDEIRPGDIITFRNAKFQGKHGPMHAKYSVDVGKPDHVGIVAEWDGTKKKVRAWEQGRESKKVKLDSFKLDDLRSGEVKIWRVMPRSWVGWQGEN